MIEKKRGAKRVGEEKWGLKVETRKQNRERSVDEGKERNQNQNQKSFIVCRDRKLS